jgi:protein-disulfide isomerase
MKLKTPVSDRDHTIGRPDAPVTLVEYGDYQCPYCGAAQPIVKQLLEHHGKDLRLVFRQFPLGEIHPMAVMAAETAEFAGAHGKFWPAHEALHAHQSRLGPAYFLEMVEGLGLDPAALKEALEAGTYTEKVQADFMGGVRSGVNGTPTFFINGHRHDGDYSFATLSRAIDALRPAAA